MEKFNSVSFKNVSIGEESFWGKRQELNHKSTCYALYDKFADRFATFEGTWKPGDPNKPHIFRDSDVAKWIEGASYILQKEEDPKLEEIIDTVVDLIEKNQDESGYFNLYFLLVEPEAKWQRRTAHELYTAGHLIEASIAYYEATGKRKFLDLMCKFADHIEEVFKIKKTAAFTTCGHPEIELALVRLYKVTGDKRYLELSKFFVDERGTKKEQMYDFALPAFDQHHVPVREQNSAEGHSVRAKYLYSGMADIAYMYDDVELFQACRRIYEDIVFRKMYITGGTGSSHLGEAYTKAYDLPNLTSYAESCAAIALVFFSWRMLKLDPDSLYSNVIERVLYNGILSSTSLDGKSYFYENPLEIQPWLLGRDVSVKDKTRLPSPKRQEVFGVSCCPPNILRFVASLGDYLYTYNNDTFYIHQYMTSDTSFDVEGELVKVTQETNYPIDGKVSIRFESENFSKIAIRIPDWCEEYSILINNEEVKPEIIKGYAIIEKTSTVIDVEIDFTLEVNLIEANPRVQENSGRVAIMRGPMVFCAESCDNGELLRDIKIPKDAKFTIGKDEEWGFITLNTTAYRRDTEDFKGKLYAPLKERKLISQDFKLIPYYAFANRGEHEMLVWFSVLE